MKGERRKGAQGLIVQRNSFPEFNNLTVKSLTDKLLSSFYSRGPRILNLRFVFLMKTQNPGSPTNKVTDGKYQKK